MCSVLSGIDWLIYSQLGNLFTIRHCCRAVATPNGLNAKTAFFSMKAAELKCQNLIVKEVHVKWNISQSDRPRTRSVDHKINKRHRQR